MLEDIGISGVYIVHGIKGYEQREKNLTELLEKKMGINAWFVTESYAESENDAWIAQYFSPDIKNVLSRGALLCTMVHILIYEQIAKRDEQYAIIFENDVCFLDAFTTNIKKVVKEADTLPGNFIISLENSTLEFPSLYKTRKNKLLYEASYGRCAGGYMIYKTAAITILNDLRKNKCREVIDWWHNSLVKRNVLQMYWAHPPLVEQGSFNGAYSSSISVRGNGSVRRFRWLSQKFYKMYILRLFK